MSDTSTAVTTRSINHNTPAAIKPFFMSAPSRIPRAPPPSAVRLPNQYNVQGGGSRQKEVC